MLKVYKGRRDDVRTVHGPLPGLTLSISYLIGPGHRSSIRYVPASNRGYA